MSKPKVVRYEPSTWGRSSPLMVKVSDGEWVRYSDYQALAAEVEDWKRAYARQEKHYQREVERFRDGARAEQKWRKKAESERDALTLAVDDWQAAAKSIAEERDALTERVRELEGQVKDARWAEARMSKQCDYETAEITRLREALECCADMLARVDRGESTQDGIDFAIVSARAALEEPNPS